MLRFCLGSLAIAALFAANAAAQPAGQYAVQRNASNADHRTPLFRHQDADHAWAAAQASGRPLFLFVTSENCFYCKKMIKQTLSHPQIGSTVAAYTEPAVVNADDNPELVRQLGVRAFPTTIVIAPDARVLYKNEGFVDAPALAERLWPVLERAEADRRLAHAATVPARPAAAYGQQQAIQASTPSQP